MSTVTAAQVSDNASNGENSTSSQKLVSVVDEKQASNEQDITESNILEVETPDTMEKAQFLCEKSQQLLKNNEIEIATDIAYQAVTVGEQCADNVNDIRLADLFMQYGKCLLSQMQQTKDVLGVGEYTVENENENENETNNEDSNNNDSATLDTAENKIEETNTLHDTDNNTTQETNESSKQSKNSKAEISDDEDQDIDIADSNNNTNNNNESGTDMKDNDDNNLTENKNDDDNDIDNENENENENENSDSIQIVCWEMLDTARYIIQNHLQNLGINFDDYDSENDNDNDGDNEENQDNQATTNAVNDTNNTNNTNNTNSTNNNDTNDENKDTNKNDSANNNEPSNKNDNSDKIDESVNNNEAIKNNDNESKTVEKMDIANEYENENENEDEDVKMEEKLRYLLQLADVHSLLGDAQLEDNNFSGALESYQLSIGFKMDCDENNRELAFSHYMAALAASHARKYDIMEQHCIDAIDLLNDKILNLIDSFKDPKYLEKTNEELDESSLNALVTEFCEEYNNKLSELSETQQKYLTEIGDLLEMMADINNKMESDLMDAQKLAQIETEQGQSIKELVKQMMLSQASNMNENENENENNNNNNNNNNVDNEPNISGVTNVSGIAFGNINSNSDNTDNTDINQVNTLTVKSKSNKKKRSYESAMDDSSNNNDNNMINDIVPKKKQRMIGKKDLN